VTRPVITAVTLQKTYTDTDYPGTIFMVFSVLPDNTLK